MRTAMRECPGISTFLLLLVLALWSLAAIAYPEETAAREFPTQYLFAHQAGGLL